MKGKKGVSVMIGYVLLVIMILSLSLLVYVWLKSQILKPVEECPQDTSLTLVDYSCNTEKKEINLTLKNKGLFNIDGFIARISNTSEGQAIHYLKSKGFIENFFSNYSKLKPNEQESKEFSYREHNRTEKIEIQPFLFEEKIILCESIISQKVEGCD